MALDAVGFALEKVLVGGVGLPGETVRILLALGGLAVTSYYDLFNRRNIPDRLLYAFFVLAVLANAVFFDPSLMIYTGAVALLLAAVGYGFYRTGQWGAADGWVVVSVALLVPIHPSFAMVLPNYPFVLSTFLFALTLFAAYIVVHFGRRLIGNRARPDMKYGLLLVPYAAMMYLLLTLPFPSLISPLYLGVLSLTIGASVFYLMYRTPIQDMLIRQTPLPEVEEGDVVALERMDNGTVERYKLPRVITAGELKRLEKLKVRSLLIYAHLPPFLPFLLAGFVVALVASPLVLPGPGF